MARDGAARSCTMVAMTFVASPPLPLAAFVGAVGDVFEHASWVADAAFGHRPFPSVSALHAAMSTLPKGTVESMAIVVPQVRGQRPVTPCGICRQALVEQERRQEGPIRLLMGIMRGPVIEMFSVDALLPLSFDSAALPGRRKKRA